METINPIVIRGTVLDARTGEPIVGANAYLKSDRTNSSYSNTLGNFTLTITEYLPNEILIVSAAGYERYKEPIKTVQPLNLRLELFKRAGVKDDRTESDVFLVNKALNGEQKAYAGLMERYRDSIYFVIQKMVKNPEDSDDLTMEAFGKAFSKLSSYSPQFAFSTWLYRIAINNCIDFVRKKRVETFSLDEEPLEEENQAFSNDFESDMPDPEEALIKEQRILHLRTVLDHLNPKYRRLIELRFMQELSYEEIADELDLPLGTVKAQLFRAKDLLANIINIRKNIY
ncbi:MAG: sigma-70 family RNA polymerase sigma factor [Sphingobacteriales bacterium]|nr:MAG: sigma-70 family RNA polymerase sigma factor [Sphingobacteriales bacterium]